MYVDKNLLQHNTTVRTQHFRSVATRRITALHGVAQRRIAPMSHAARGLSRTALRHVPSLVSLARRLRIADGMSQIAYGLSS